MNKPIPTRAFILSLVALLATFSWPLFQLVRFSLGSNLYSHLVLVAIVSIYLFWVKRPRGLSTETFLPRAWPLTFIGGGLALLAFYWIAPLSGSPLVLQDSFVLAVYSLILLLTGVCCWFLSRAYLRALAFPLAFLVFMAPFPLWVEQGMEVLLQHGSAWVSHVFFMIIGTPVFRDGTFFQLPGFNMQVAPECSGIHSTLALFITSLVAGQVLLRSNLHRAVLTLAVIPIALLRNGLRVTTIGELCVRISPEMIDSYIHRQGGPIFFGLSLVPFAILLLFLLKLDRRQRPPVNLVP